MRVLLFGDSVALTLGLGLGLPKEQQKYGYVLSDKGILGCGVVFGPEVELMGTRYDTPQACGGSGVEPGGPTANEPWPNQWLSAIGQVKPNVVVLLAGRWEVVDREYQGNVDQHPEPDLRRLREEPAGAGVAAGRRRRAPTWCS